MKPKIAGTGSETNTVQAGFDNITAYGKRITKPQRMFEIGEYCDLTFN